MTLDEALAYARAHQPSLQGARARASAAAADAQVPRARWYPRAGASAQLLEGTTNNSTASIVTSSALELARIGATPAEPSGTWAPSASSVVGVGLRQEVFDFGKIAAQSAVLDALAEAQALRSQSEALDVELAVRESFFAVQGAKAVLLAAEAAYLRVKANRDLAAAGVKSGLRSPIELTRAEADLMRLDVGRIRAQGALTVAQQTFAAVVGAPDGLLDARGDPAVPPAPPLERVLGDALAKDPDVLAAQARVRAQEATSTQITSELRPDLHLTSTLSGRAGGATPSGTGGLPPGNGYLPDIPNWDVGLVLSWPFFDATVFARKNASLASEGARRAELDAERLRVRTAIEQAYASTDVALQAVPALERAAAAARDNDAQASARFRAGLGTSVELADAEALRTEADIQLALGKFEYARARALLGRAIAEAR